MFTWKWLVTFGDGVTNWLCEIQEISFGFKNATRASINITRDAFWVSYSFQVPSVSYQFEALGESQFLVWRNKTKENKKFETFDILENVNGVWKLISTTV